MKFKDWPEVSIIVPIFNTTEEMRDLVTRALLQVKQSTSASYELILLDNGSKHPLGDQGLPERIYRDENSIAGAWNEGTRRANGNVFCFLNDDCFVEPGWDDQLIACALAGPHVACPWTNGEKSDGVGITGWCWMVARQTFQLVGRFDEHFSPFFWEDTDWFHRAVLRGVRLLSVPSSRVIHQRRTTCKTMPHWEHLFVSGRFRFAWKHGLEDPMAAPAHWQRPLQEWPIGTDLIDPVSRPGASGSRFSASLYGDPSGSERLAGSDPA